MKAIGVKMVDLTPMSARNAKEAGYRVTESQWSINIDGYKVEYPDGYSSWCPKAVADKAYFQLAKPMGNSLTPVDINNFIKDIEVKTVGVKTTQVLVTAKTGFESVGTSSCVDANNYDINIGESFARTNAEDKIWEGLGFVLQWALNGLK